MDDKKYINISDLKNISKNMHTKKNDIIDIYNKDVKELLLNSKDCIEYANQKYDELDIFFKNSFSKFSDNFDELLNILDNKVIPSYEDLSNNIKTLFNEQFAKKFENFVDFYDNMEEWL